MKWNECEAAEDSTIDARASARAPLCSLPDPLHRRGIMRGRQQKDKREGLPYRPAAFVLPVNLLQANPPFRKIRDKRRVALLGNLRHLLCICGVEVFGRKKLRRLRGHFLYLAKGT